MGDFDDLAEAPPEKLLEHWGALGRAALARGPNELRQALIGARMATMMIGDLAHEDERKAVKRIVDDVRTLSAHGLRTLTYSIFFSDSVFLEMVSMVTGEDVVEWDSLTEDELLRICEMYTCVMLARDTFDSDWVLDLCADREASTLDLTDIRPTTYRSIYSDMSPDLADALQRMWVAESACSADGRTPQNVGALLGARALVMESYSMHFAERIAVLAWCVLSFCERPETIP